MGRRAAEAGAGRRPARARSSWWSRPTRRSCPHQCERLAQRAGLGIARAGGTGGHTSGDLFIAFATGNRLPPDDEDRPNGLVHDVRTVGDGIIDALFDGVIEATEEAIINALVAAETMTGRDGVTAHALPHDRLLEVMARYGRGPGQLRVRLIRRTRIPTSLTSWAWADNGRSRIVHRRPLSSVDRPPADGPTMPM